MENKQFKGVWLQGKISDYGKDDHLYYGPHHNTILKRNFTLDTLSKHSILRIACLGYYVVYINGKRVLDYELNNDWTNYTKCVYYEEYNINEYLKIGENQIEVMLGNGMYNPAPLKLFGKYNLRERLAEVGDPKMICDLIIADTMIISSDENWSYYNGQYLFNNLYLGETIDYTYQDKTEYPVITSQKQYTFQKSFIPKIKRSSIVKPVIIEKYEVGLFVDFGEMISGFIDIQIDGKQNQEVQLQYSERYKDGRFDFSTCLSGSVGEQMGAFTIDGGQGAPKYAIQTDTIKCIQGMNHFTNTFTYHSFRYVYITGCTKQEIKELQAIYVHTDLKQTGSVNSDCQEINELYKAGLRTRLNNVHGVFEDCARERLGYGGDIVALATSNLYMFDLENMYKKVIMDFRFDQTVDGGIPETAPYMGIQSNGTNQGEGPLLWQLVYPYLVNKRYQYYGDVDTVKQELPYIIKHINYILKFDIEELVHKCLGDHGSILISGQFRKPTPDKLFLGYCAVLLLIKNVIDIFKIVKQDSKYYQQKYNEIKDMVMENFLNEDGSYGEGSQTSYAFALYLELSNIDILAKKFVDKIQEDNYKFTTGIFGMSFSYEVLTKLGYNEVIEKWLLSKEQNTYLDMLSTGNKALAELFIGEHLSLNHAMFASYQQWYYQGLGGILIDEDAIAFNKVMFKPYFSKAINEYCCTLKTKQGVITSSWKRENSTVVWNLEIPHNIKYTIALQDAYKEVFRNKTENTYTLIIQE